jgi:tRNA A37 threonylcarbamoyladenosine modification protein TsaB
VILLFNFLKENNMKINDINNIFVNQGPGKFSGIRSSIAVAKALSITNKLDLYGFNSNQVEKKNYKKILNLYEKGILKKNLIKPLYLS